MLALRKSKGRHIERESGRREALPLLKENGGHSSFKEIEVKKERSRE